MPSIKISKATVDAAQPSVADKVYWDNTNKRATKIATDNTLIGVALVAVGSGADETMGRVRLNGSF